jgi:hypothetical protein
VIRRPTTRPKRPGLYSPRGQSPVNGAEKKPSTAKMGRLVARVSPTFAMRRCLLGVPCFPSGAQGPALWKHVLLTFAAPPACFREQHAEAWHRRMETCHRPQDCLAQDRLARGTIGPGSFTPVHGASPRRSASEGGYRPGLLALGTSDSNLHLLSL